MRSRFHEFAGIQNDDSIAVYNGRQPMRDGEDGVEQHHHPLPQDRHHREAQPPEEEAVAAVLVQPVHDARHERDEPDDGERVHDGVAEHLARRAGGGAGAGGGGGGAGQKGSQKGKGGGKGWSDWTKSEKCCLLYTSDAADE